MPKLYIDNKPYEVNTGKNLLESCLNLGFDVPYFCWHPALGSVGACRQCAVKAYKDADDKKGKLIMSCMEPVSDGQRISIQDPEAKEFRERIIEWLMTNHPHDCAVCDEGGTCHLQDMTVMTGHAYRRFRYKKRSYKNQDLGPFVNHEMNRCIQCYRCVRFYKDYAGGHDLDVFASRNNVYFGRHEEGTLENEFSGNLAEVCPTGVFTDKTLKQHYTRKWDLTTAPSVCHHCSVGCNTIAGERYGELRSITNRYNGKVNGYFICDRGRFGYEFVNATARIKTPIIQGVAVDAPKALQETKSLLRGGRVIGIGSARASVQSNFALKALVGKENFFQGVAENQYKLSKLVLQIMQGPAHTFSLREVESADALFIVGEDLTNTAPMLALAVRQSVRQQPLENVIKSNIPVWHDAAARELIQDRNGPCFIAALNSTKLDEVATHTFRDTPQEIARLAYAVAHLIDAKAPAVADVSPETNVLAQEIAKTLLRAQRPLIISGTSCGSEDVLRSAANVAHALTLKNKSAGIVLTVPESNSLGIAMLGGKSLPDAFEAVENNRADTVIILENDLYRHADKNSVDKFLNRCKNVIALDHSSNDTTQRAKVILPAGTFAESDGILVNNEGRAQRFFQVFNPTEPVRESWRWVLALNETQANQSQNYDDITRALEKEEPFFKGITTLSPPADSRIAGQKIPRETHRFSGRTAMHAHIAVSEEKPPEDPDSPLSFTMEGFRGLPPSNMIPFFWSPGWNSIQSVSKYQEAVGGELRGGDPGLRLFDGAHNQSVAYFNDVPEVFNANKNQLLILPLYHIYGSEELSARSAAVAQRVPKPYVLVNSTDASTLKLKEDSELTFSIGGTEYHLPVKISVAMRRGVGGLPYGLPDFPFVQLPAFAVLMKQ